MQMLEEVRHTLFSKFEQFWEDKHSTHVLFEILQMRFGDVRHWELETHPNSHWFVSVLQRLLGGVLQSEFDRQGTQVLLDVLHFGADEEVQSESWRHPRHTLLVVSHVVLGATTHWELEVQPSSHRLVSVLQRLLGGVVQSEFWRHSTQSWVSVLQTFPAEQSELETQPTQVLDVTSQAGVEPEQFKEDMHSTQSSVLMLQAEVAPEHWLCWVHPRIQNSPVTLQMKLGAVWQSLLLRHP